MTNVLQLRIYEIREGFMQEWLKLFETKLLRLHDEAGIPVTFYARNVNNVNEFVWMRRFDSVDTIQAQETTFFSLPERVALGDVRGTYVNKFEIRIISETM